MTYRNVTTWPAAMCGVAAASTATMLCKPNTCVAEMVAEVNTHTPYSGSHPCCYGIIIFTRTIKGEPPSVSAQPAEFGCLHTDNAKGAPGIGTLDPAGGLLASGGAPCGGIFVHMEAVFQQGASWEWDVLRG